MALQIFIRPEKPKAKPKPPRVTIPAGRTGMSLSREAMALLEFEPGTKHRVLLVVDRATNIWGVAKTEADDKRGFFVTTGSTGNGRVLQCKVFIDTLNLDSGEYIVAKTSTPNAKNVVVTQYRQHDEPTVKE